MVELSVNGDGADHVRPAPAIEPANCAAVAWHMAAAPPYAAKVAWWSTAEHSPEPNAAASEAKAPGVSEVALGGSAGAEAGG